MNIGFILNYCSKLLRNRLNRELEKEDITLSQFATIKDIEMNSFKYGQEVGVTAVEISERLDMDKPTISGIINRLVDKDYVKKLSNPNDKRSFILKLTDKSKAKLPILEKINDSVVNDAIEGLTKDEIDMFKKITKKIIENMR
ncbi:multiple antibiotic resistance protein MarR [Tissierella creatinophila DSM 6911]|uniref:Multiple antibiotic resistance protein MarR n=2 Tax=Tissierella creatinophila TaxID=79681 RepID=A0A1U7M774_TISCR|nr:multiple antibiotic resistance protein MarR [Tissierella creatinophila DSM 6911]